MRKKKTDEQNADDEDDYEADITEKAGPSSSSADSLRNRKKGDKTDLETNAKDSHQEDDAEDIEELEGVSLVRIILLFLINQF